MWSTNETVGVIQHLAGEYEILTYTYCMNDLSAMLHALKNTDLTIRVFKNPLKIETEFILHGSTKWFLWWIQTIALSSVYEMHTLLSHSVQNTTHQNENTTLCAWKLMMSIGLSKIIAIFSPFPL